MADILESMPEAETAGLRKMIAELQREVQVASSKPDSPAHNSNIILYPDAVETVLAKDIGIVLDHQHNVRELLKINAIQPPDKLHWLNLQTYDAFKLFLEKRGIPNYISFGIIAKPKTSYDCATLLIKTCRKQGLKTLPNYQVHTPVLTQKQKLDLLLLDY